MTPESRFTELIHPTDVQPRRVKKRLLAICNIDTMAWALLRQWLDGLQKAGYEVHIACAPGDFFPRLAAEGFHMHAIPIRRTFHPWAHIRPFFELWKLIRRGAFDVVNTHSAVAAAPGRMAAWIAGCPCIVYTVHGFYFHDDMPALPRGLYISIEWLLGRITNSFMFVSDEDRSTAIRTGIVPAKTKATTIFNGVDLDAFAPKDALAESTRLLRHELGLDDSVAVVGIVGRIVKEKGHREFLEMARYVATRRNVRFLVVGDSLPSDRDQFAPVFKQQVANAELMSHFIFTGQTERVSDYLRVMDIFVLPSYREGFPRSIVEAMSAALPVVTTDIRGCREATVDGKTGLIVPARDGEALARAVDRLLANPREAVTMGRAGRDRAIAFYDFRIVQRRFVEIIREADDAMANSQTSQRPR